MRKLVFLIAVSLAIAVGYWRHDQTIQRQAAASEQARLERPRTDEEIRQAIRQSLDESDGRAPSPGNIARQNIPVEATGFKCDGRKHCSQMTSCEEAKFFLRSCPGVKMDGGDGHGAPDGVPCESQWCGDD